MSYPACIQDIFNHLHTLFTTDFVTVNTSTVNGIHCHILVVPCSILWSTGLFTSNSSESCPKWNEFYRHVVVSVISKPASRTYQNYYKILNVSHIKS